VQGPSGSFTQDFCNVPAPQNASRTYTLAPCVTPSPTPTATPTTIVTNTNDSGPGSLRQALADAHDGDTIRFNSALNGQTIALTTAELVIDKNVTVRGLGANLVAVSRSSNMPFRIFHIMPGRAVTIQGLTVTHGGLGFGDAGAGILNDHATLTVRDCDIKFNASAYAGGGVFSDGSNGSATLTVIDSTVSSNSSPFGGGIVSDVGNQGSATLTVLSSAVTNNISTNGSPPYDFGAAAGIASSGTAMISNSAISDNLASNEGGGILSDGTLTITNSTISGNGAGGFGQNNWPGLGGGISSGGALTVSNSTISGNTAAGNNFKGLGHGGGVFNYSGSTATLNNSTFSGNRANVGGGVCNNGSAEVRSTIFNAGPSGENIFNSGGTITSDGYNVSSDDGGGYLNGPGDQINTDPLLGPLQDNGGRTFTHALLPGSPAIDAGDPNFTPPPYYDQRGLRFRRVFNGRIDVGAFEVQPEPPPFPTPRPRPTAPPRP
jgi:hypothetical protein